MVCLTGHPIFDIAASIAKFEHLEGELGACKARETSLQEQLTGLWTTGFSHHIEACKFLHCHSMEITHAQTHKPNTIQWNILIAGVVSNSQDGNWFLYFRKFNGVGVGWVRGGAWRVGWLGGGWGWWWGGYNVRVCFPEHSAQSRRVTHSPILG